jgi:AraC-like DNA-binding protein
MKNNDFKKVLDTDFSISHRVDDSFSMNTFHFHSVFEIYFAQTGGLKYFVDNRIYPVEKNDLFIFNHLDLHRIDISPGMRYDRYYIVFNPNYVKDLCTSSTDLLECFLNRNPNFCHRIHLSQKQAELYMSLFKKAQKHYNSRLYGDDVYRKLALTEVLIFINRLYRDNDCSIPGCNDTKYTRIKPVLSHINENLQQKLSLDRLANRFYISKYHLCKIFKEVTGFTVNEYIIYRRIILASELLRRNLPVSNVSEMTGFQNDCHFITTFKKFAGITPKQYAKKGL